MTQSERQDRFAARVETPIFEQIALALRESGYNASVEYPGFVQVAVGSDTLVNIGTANGHWGYDVTDAQGYGTGDEDFLTGADAPASEVVAVVVDVLEGLV